MAGAERLPDERWGGDGSKPGIVLCAGACGEGGEGGEGGGGVFLDDDNIPSPDWQEVAVGAFAGRPETGVTGGKVEACWEVVAEFELAIC